MQQKITKAVDICCDTPCKKTCFNKEPAVDGTLLELNGGVGEGVGASTLLVLSDKATSTSSHHSSPNNTSSNDIEVLSALAGGIPYSSSFSCEKNILDHIYI